MTNVPQNSLQAVSDLRGAYIRYLEDLASEHRANDEGDGEATAAHILTHVPEVHTATEQELLAHIAAQFEHPIEWIFEIWGLDD